ncbi:hypothetical protein ACFO0N_00395 [Halobium salinum]|uniref:DUF2795 domain-containing protein n=1 Tax=Halobium salinum TaxID=1364940 RepID=A0ABD5P6F7_9EURY|nr:hypothetical protein [Halobium salinum]
MSQSVKLNSVETLFGDLEYPITRKEASAAYAGTTLLLADGETDLGRVVAETVSDTFEGPDELFADLHTALPIEAVGEPGQSDGDA